MITKVIPPFAAAICSHFFIRKFVFCLSWDLSRYVPGVLCRHSCHCCPSSSAVGVIGVVVTVVACLYHPHLHNIHPRPVYSFTDHTIPLPFPAHRHKSSCPRCTGKTTLPSWLGLSSESLSAQGTVGDWLKNQWHTEIKHDWVVVSGIHSSLFAPLSARST